MRLNAATLAGAALGGILFGLAPALAQAPPVTNTAAPAATAAPKPPAKPAEKAPEARKRGPPKSYAHCLGLARKEGLRGAQRRRYVSRCQLGFENAQLGNAALVLDPA